MIDPALAALLEGPVMMIFASRAADGSPALGRGAGARAAAGGEEIVFYASAAQWPLALDGLRVGDPIAFTFCRPADYRTFQVKGPLLGVGPMDAADEARLVAYVATVREALHGLGVDDHLIDQWLLADRPVAVRMRAEQVFAQTPGPGAGAPLEPAA